MAGPSSKCAVPVFSGEDYTLWSRKMKKLLTSEGLWYSVEQGFQQPKPRAKLSAAQMEELKQDKVNDAAALSLIHRSLPSSIFMKIVDAKTSKEAWDTLYSIFHAKKTKGGSSAKTLNESRRVGEDDSFDVGDEGVMPLSGDKPFFDVVVTRSALKPRFQMYFPARADSVLASTNVKAKVRLLGKVYEIIFYGEMRQKKFGRGWKQLVDEHNLEEGDFLVFEVMESDDSKLELNLQILRCTIPPELEQEIARRERESKDVIVIDDYNHGCDHNDAEVVVVDSDDE